MAKIKLDKYYTPKELAEYCVNKTKKIVGEENITEWLEPSAGGGVFLEYLPDNTLAYDLYPEDNRIVEQDYLKLDLDFKKGRCIIGNPPFGTHNYTAVKFFKKSILLGDYVAFILPISQLNNNMYMYEFDLIYSEDLGIKKYSEIDIHCCFNIYIRPNHGLNKKPNYDLKDVVLKTVNRGKSRNDKVPEVYDFSICGFGASMGKICERENQYCQQIYFTINNIELKNKLYNFIVNTNWNDVCKSTSSPKLKHWVINKYIKEHFPEIN